MIQDKSTKKLVQLTLVLLCIFLLSQILPAFSAVYRVAIFLFIPLILSIYAFYALRPVKMGLLKVFKKNKIVAPIVFLLFIVVLIVMVGVISNIFVVQIQTITSGLSFDKLKDIRVPFLPEISSVVNIEEYLKKATDFLTNWIQTLPSQVPTFASNVSSVGTQFVLFLLGTFYLLSDENKVADAVQVRIKGKYEKELLCMFEDIHGTLKTYISGQIMVSIILGTMMLVGYLVIGLPYAIIMAMIALITNLIPFIGPFIGAFPAVLIGFASSGSLGIKVIVLTIVIQQLESNLVTPHVMGSKLDVHPFMVILVVLAGMSLFGVIGALFATPVYMSLKIIVKTLYQINRKRKSDKLAETKSEIEIV